jgi:hypothetical protein
LAVAAAGCAGAARSAARGAGAAAGSRAANSIIDHFTQPGPVENAANAAVCSGRMSLVTAQQSIIQDWYRFGQQLGVVAQ